jgi:hypothetical protein
MPDRRSTAGTRRAIPNPGENDLFTWTTGYQAESERWNETVPNTHQDVTDPFMGQLIEIYPFLQALPATPRT